jgi:two-component system sensor histidine kinase BaeS
MFLDPDGRLLVSSDPQDSQRLGLILTIEDIADIQQGETIHHIKYSKGLQQEVIDVLVPAINSDNQVIGIIRLSHPYETVYEDLLQMRLIILGILGFALFAGISLGSFLAVTINTPVRQVTKAIDDLASGNQLEKLEQQGPEEIVSLVNSTNSLVARLHNLEQARKQLLANLVHEIGRPLGAIRSAIQSLKLGAGKDPQLLAELTNGMDAETARLQHLLDDLAHLHDQVFGTLELNRQSISAKTWLKTVLRPWEEEAHKKGLQWVLSISEDFPDFQADPLRLSQAIENLVSNAIKYTPKGGTLTVRTANTSDAIFIEVEDSGPGISQDEQQKIFEPFYRGDQKKRIKQGMGLGLSIAHDVIAAHGGKITLQSKPGQGSRFTIAIPRTD